MGSSAVLLFSCILSTLVVAGFSLICTECEGEDEKTCKGSPATCPPESEFCMAVLKSTMSTIEGGQEVKQYKRSCGEKSMCSQKESFTYSDGVIKISSSCCSTSNCVPPMPALPQTKTEKNGVSCMECRGSGDTPCTSSTRRDCTGDEKQCVALTITAKPSPDTSLSGCGTPALCMKKMDFKTGDTVQEMKFSCPSGSASLQYTLSLLIFAPIFLVKVIG
ncbi:phospholipase A2 inhibitor and Ly6/PLAUR domain-containing protein-like [Rana temporaria]|uniref:phospholipase A2 inhibitor and Ly6/PLAUR domain-containing protein-like n=1 Tax=Rana temporaria TaxID=8407 RepID=UPI001AAE07AF|nr:phospholipase A2 inhibitor and Ly6/PLAUR domain-containing protein-like [Rana temporaria]